MRLVPILAVALSSVVVGSATAASAATPAVSAVALQQTAPYANKLAVTWVAVAGAGRFEVEVRQLETVTGIFPKESGVTFVWKRTTVSGSARNAVVAMGAGFADHVTQRVRVRSCDAVTCSAWTYSARFKGVKPPLAEQKDRLMALAADGTAATMERLLAARPFWYPYASWSADVCSSSYDKPTVDDAVRTSFTNLCRMHDFLYRNAKRLAALGVTGVWDATNRLRYDNRLLSALEQVCTSASIAGTIGPTAYLGCMNDADAYYDMVRASDGP